MSKRKFTRNKSVFHIPNSRDKSNKVVYPGKKGKDCIFFNAEKLSCNCPYSMHDKSLCISDKCTEYKHK